jgi:hypothetical protein
MTSEAALAADQLNQELQGWREQPVVFRSLETIIALASKVARLAAIATAQERINDLDAENSALKERLATVDSITALLAY